jgi:hypothetical protein
MHVVPNCVGDVIILTSEGPEDRRAVVTSRDIDHLDSSAHCTRHDSKLLKQRKVCMMTMTMLLLLL